MSQKIDPEKLAQIQAKMAQMPPKSLGRLMDDMSSRNPVALAQLVTSMNPQLLAQAAKYMKPEVVAQLREQIAKQFYANKGGEDKQSGGAGAADDGAAAGSPEPEGSGMSTPKAAGGEARAKTFRTPIEFEGIVDEHGRPITPEERERLRRRALKAEMGFEDDDDDDDDDDDVDGVDADGGRGGGGGGGGYGGGARGYGDYDDEDDADLDGPSFYDPSSMGAEDSGGAAAGTPGAGSGSGYGSGGGGSGGGGGVSMREIQDLKRAMREMLQLKRRSDEAARLSESKCRKAQDQLTTAQRLSRAQIQILRNSHEAALEASGALGEECLDALRACEDLVAAREVDGDDVPAKEVRAALGEVRRVVEGHGGKRDAAKRDFESHASGKGLDPVEEVIAENVVLRRQLDEYEAEEAGLGEKGRLRSEVERLSAELERARQDGITVERFRELVSENEFLSESVERVEAKCASLEAEADERVREAEARAAESDRVRAMRDAEERVGKVRTELAEATRERDELRARVAELEGRCDQLSSGPASGAGEDVRREIARIDREFRSFVSSFDLLEEAVLAQQQQIRPALEEAAAPLLRVLESQDKVESALLGKYRREVAERKRLFNLVQELRGNIRVFVRCRPLLQDEVEAGKTPAFSFGDDFDDEALSITDDRGTVKPFKFDRVYGHSATQERIFEDTKPLVTSVMDGYNVCIFAYGQTGSGKTFTMQGPDGDPGVNLRTLIELFTLAEERSDDWRYNIKVAMVEIYNETIRDLLDPESMKKKYEIRQGPEGNYVPGLVEVTVSCIEDVTRLMQLGNENRSMASTAMNEYSSRSHSLLLITVEGNNTVTKVRVRSKLTLVDLAGSERVSKSEVTGQRLVEAQNINKSLSALGDVMAGLHQSNSHIPYRNSKLTHLLADSLGGDSKTCVFIHCAPDRDNVKESICSLNFAVRVSKVELGQATRQVVGAKKGKK